MPGCKRGDGRGGRLTLPHSQVGPACCLVANHARLTTCSEPQGCRRVGWAFSLDSPYPALTFAPASPYQTPLTPKKH